MTFLKRSNHLEFIISLTLDSGEIEKSRKLIIPDIGFVYSQKIQKETLYCYCIKKSRKLIIPGIGFDENRKGDLVLFR